MMLGRVRHFLVRGRVVGIGADRVDEHPKSLRL